jgi:glutamine synthetase
MDGLRAGLEMLPGDLGDRAGCAEQDEVIPTRWGNMSTNALSRPTAVEWGEYQRCVTQWELDRYLKLY